VRSIAKMVNDDWHDVSLTPDLCFLLHFFVELMTS